MSLAGRFLDHPEPVVTAALAGNRLAARYQIEAEVTGEAGAQRGAKGDVRRVAYRQYVRGSYSVNGVPVRHLLSEGAQLHPEEFRLDGTPGSACLGDRKATEPWNYGYSEPEDEDGTCRFSGWDEPGIACNVPGARLELDLEYEGVLIDTRKGERLAEIRWIVKGADSVPGPMRGESASVDKDGVCTIALLELNPTPDGGWSGQISVSRPMTEDGAVPDLSFDVLDREGSQMPVETNARGALIQTGGATHRTWSLGFMLKPGPTAPEAVSGLCDGAAFRIDLAPAGADAGS